MPQRGAEAKAAAKAAPRENDDDDRTYTHMGPGSGSAGAADRKGTASILNSGRGAAPAVERKAAAPSAEPNAPAPATDSRTAASAVEAKTAPVEAAAQALRDKALDDRLKAGASGDDAAGTLPTPRVPGQQSSDSGLAGSAPGATSGGTSNSGDGSGAESGRSPFGGVLTDRLDATAAGALSQLDGARPGLKGGLDVFQSATSTSSVPGGSVASHDDQLAAAGSASGGNPSLTSSDPGADHAAGAVGQITGGRGSASTILGDRLADAKGDLDIMGGLLGDQAARASGPSVAAGTTGSAAGMVAGETAAAIATSAAAAAKTGAIIEGAAAGATASGAAGLGFMSEAAAAATATAAAGVAGVVAAGAIGYAAGSIVAETTSEQTTRLIDAAVSSTEQSTEETAAEAKAAYEAGKARKAEREAEEGSGQSTEPDANGQSTEPASNDQSTEPGAGGGVGMPGDPLDPNSGVPTPAQIAFRAALRQALGANSNGSGDIDPADNGGAPAVGGSAFAGAANDNTGLIGQPGRTGTAGGTMRGPSTGTDVDPVEGSAFSGPALGGNPEDLEFGTDTLPLDSLPRARTNDDSSSRDDDDDE